MAEMSEDFLVSENEISSLLLDVDGELEICVEYDEEELGNFMEEDFVLPELLSIEETVVHCSVPESGGSRYSNENLFCCEKCSKIYLKEHFYNKHIRLCSCPSSLKTTKDNFEGKVM